MAEDWEVLEVLGSEEEAGVICGYLESQGVPCQVESAHSHEFPVNVSALGNVRIEVQAGRLDEARRLLAERESAPALAEDEEGS
ncbi:MAG TPA: DUF2007 domain-containing protein [Thermoanaerobaculia bacterium]|jgi:hypothetical protein|nr:DUF2007 domain-containing protein [Thermoanaerobaculia bacterium]